MLSFVLHIVLAEVTIEIRSIVLSKMTFKNYCLWEVTFEIRTIVLSKMTFENYCLG